MEGGNFEGPVNCGGGALICESTIPRRCGRNCFFPCNCGVLSTSLEFPPSLPNGAQEPEQPRNDGSDHQKPSRELRPIADAIGRHQRHQVEAKPGWTCRQSFPVWTPPSSCRRLQAGRRGCGVSASLYEQIPSKHRRRSQTPTQAPTLIFKVWIRGVVTRNQNLQSPRPIFISPSCPYRERPRGGHAGLATGARRPLEVDASSHNPAWGNRPDLPTLPKLPWSLHVVWSPDVDLGTKAAPSCHYNYQYQDITYAGSESWCSTCDHRFGSRTSLTVGRRRRRAALLSVEALQICACNCERIISGSRFEGRPFREPPDVELCQCLMARLGM